MREFVAFFHEFIRGICTIFMVGLVVFVFLLPMFI